jgi:glucose-1-phosphate thymidylyltransferase
MVLDKALLLARGAGPDDPGGASDAPRPSLVSLPITNRPLLEHHLDYLGAAGVTRIGIACDTDVRLEVEKHVAQPGSRRAHIEIFDRAPGASLASVMFAAREFLGHDPFMLHLGDSLIHGSLGELLSDVSGAERDSVAFVQPGNSTPLRAIGGRAFRPGLARHAGIYWLGSAFVQAVAETEPCELEEEINAALERMTLDGGRHELVEVEAWRWTPGGEGLLRANHFALDGLQSAYDEASLDDSTVEGAVQIHGSARIESSVVRGPAVIGANACVVDSYVGPYSVIGAGVEFVGSEVENSVIRDGASIRHIGTRLDRSVIGPGARITREFSVPRAMRLEVGPSAEIKLS